MNEFYAKIAYPDNPRDAKRCAVCLGAKYVRHGELVPGQAGFGAKIVCPNYSTEQRRCVPPVEQAGMFE